MNGKLRAWVLGGVVGAAALWGAFSLWDGQSPKGEDEAVAFEVLDAAHQELDGTPALALSFTRPLDRKQDYAGLVTVVELGPEKVAPKTSDGAENEGGSSEEEAQAAPSSVKRLAPEAPWEEGTPVKGAWVVGENPRMLYFPHIKPETRYGLRIQAGLPAQGGVKLASETRFQMKTAAVAPAYYFASKGMVLPAVQNGGLPVVTVNVPEVDIQFLRVRDDQLPAFLERVIAGPARARVTEDEEDASEEGSGSANLRGSVSIWDVDQIHKMTESVFAGRFVTEQKTNRRGVTFIPVENVPALQSPGVYVAVMSQPNRFRYEVQTTYYYVSDLGLHVRQYANQSADAYVSSLADAQPTAGVEVSWLDGKGQVLLRGETDSEGRAAFALRPKGAKVLVARKGKQLSLIALKEPALDLAEFDIKGMTSSSVRLFAYSGRDLYRPGENFEVSVLARDADGRAVPPQPIQALLRRPDGRAQWTATLQPDKQFAGYYRHAIDLPADAATGAWNLELRADPAAKMPSTAYRFGVEEFLPERMKLDLRSKQADLRADGPWSIDVSGMYLYGAPAANNRLMGVAYFERRANPLDKTLPGFVFGDADEDTVRSRVELDEQTLNEQGHAALQVSTGDLAKRRSPFAVRATLSLLESGGRPVVRSIERVYWPAPTLVGVRPLFEGAYASEGSNAGFEVALADAGGTLKAASGLPVRLFRENRQWYWRFDDQRGWNSGFTETDELVLATQVSLPAGGRGKLALPVKYGRYRLEVLNPETGLLTRYRFYAGWSAKDDESQGVRPDRVALKLDKATYNDGDTVKLTVTPPHAGEALITVEGDQRLWSRRVSVPIEGKTLEIPLEAAWKRHDLYATVMVLRPGAAGEKGGAGVTPARALGLVHLPLAREERKLAVSLEAPQKMVPDQALKVKVKAPGAKGTQAMVTVSAVDAGILNITGFKSPDPHGFFFGKLRYQHDLYDVYGRLIEKMAGQKGALKWGGDAAPKPTKNLPKKVRLVDLFSGPVALDANGEAEVSLPVPDFNGALRLMATVSSADRFGQQEQEVTVAAPLVLELATPRFLSVGDAAMLALDVHNLSGAEQAVQVRVKNADGLTIRQGEQALTLKNQEKRVLRVPLEAGSALGLTEVSVQVDSPAAKLKRTFPLVVQSPTPRQSVVRRYDIAPGGTLEVKEANLAGLGRAGILASLAVSDRPPIDVKSVVQGLLSYPYGCAEQTTSAAYPHLWIDEAAAKTLSLKPLSLAQRAEIIGKAIGRLAGMQAPNGGFSLWGQHSEAQYWLSAYVTHFLLDAREQGFAVPEALEKKAVEYLLSGLQQGVAGLPKGVVKYDENAIWNDTRFAGSGRFGVLAYGAYVLARHNKAPLSTLRQLDESRDQAYSGLSLVHLGLALKLMGDAPRAQSALEAGVIKPRINDRWWGDYGSALRDAALSAVLLRQHGVEVQGRENLVLTVAGALENQSYLSTQEKMAVFLLGRDDLAKPGQMWKAEALRSAHAQTLGGQGTQFMALQAADLVSGVTIRNTHTDKLYVALAYSGHPQKMPPARQDVFELKRTWYTPDGKALGSRPLRVGETLVVHLRVKTRGQYANGLVVDYVPAGVEIENANLVQGEAGAVEIAGVDVRAAMQDARIKHTEYRDDRFVVAARLQEQLDLFYRVRVVTPGTFVVPPTYAEDMYQPALFGLAGGGERVTIVDGKSPAP